MSSAESESVSPGASVSGVEVEVAAEAAEWRRLDRRTVLVTAVVMAGVAAGAGLPTAIGLAGGMPLWQALGWVLAGAVPVVAAIAGGDYVRWSRTRYRIGPERAELHTGLLLVRRRSLARERIRSVDLTASPLLRVLGLVKVRIGTGEHTGGGASTLELDAVTKAEGERLRTELLARAATAPGGTHQEGVLAALDPSWIRYAPVSFVAPLLGGAAAGAVMQVSEWFGAQGRVIEWVGDRFQDTPVVLMIVVLVVAAGVAGVVGALGLWIEMWWNYRLEREPGGTLRVRRGLFTTRSISIEERRLRGVEMVEPLGVRLFGAARVDAVATGLTEEEGGRQADLKVLLPPAPRAVAEEVAAQVLREPAAPTSTARLTAHPPAARTRRLRWAVTAVLLLVAVPAVLGALFTPVLLYIAAACAAVGLPVGVILALDAYRSLGHGISGAYLVARSGTVRRATVALQRGGVIGWTVKQSCFQRRSGLITLRATTAAGAGAYDVYDAAEGEGLTFAAEAVPGVLEPFLVRGDGTSGGDLVGDGATIPV
ncbi:PH domain-containing protein [Streptomyces sp. NBC_01142]|uniref:PH domain-containing protein n=1 Tax=Streptomyces sp. NBC_01142 TaxID=2975865 RepID=UPI00224E72D7|nr:PH domain-containing protein [Streptomyces sp. NBC_01142]MCX4822280.1 PH domain-containing protein [Streptomyces sp. NBC_01142]